MFLSICQNLMFAWSAKLNSRPNLIFSWSAKLRHFCDAPKFLPAKISSSQIMYIYTYNHYALFIIIAQILLNLTFPLFMAIIKTQNQRKLRSTLENAKSNQWNDMRIGVNSSFLCVTIRLRKLQLLRICL